MARTHPPHTGETLATTAEQLYVKGYAEGYAKGYAEGLTGNTGIATDVHARRRIRRPRQQHRRRAAHATRGIWLWASKLAQGAKTSMTSRQLALNVSWWWWCWEASRIAV